jgi:hypothetical protein
MDSSTTRLGAPIILPSVAKREKAARSCFSFARSGRNHLHPRYWHDLGKVYPSERCRTSAPALSEAHLPFLVREPYQALADRTPMAVLAPSDRRRQGCEHDGQGPRVAHMPTAATADAASRCVIERNDERSGLPTTKPLKRSRGAGPSHSLQCAFIRSVLRRCKSSPNEETDVFSGAIDDNKYSRAIATLAEPDDKPDYAQRAALAMQVLAKPDGRQLIRTVYYQARQWPTGRLAPLLLRFTRRAGMSDRRRVKRRGISQRYAPLAAGPGRRSAGTAPVDFGAASSAQ